MNEAYARTRPQAEALLETIDAMGMPPTYGLAVESARARLEELFAGGGGEDVDRVEEFAIGGPAEPIPVRLSGPAGDGHPLAVFLHGVHESEALVGQPKVTDFR